MKSEEKVDSSPFGSENPILGSFGRLKEQEYENGRKVAINDI